MFQRRDVAGSENKSWHESLLNQLKIPDVKWHIHRLFAYSAERIKYSSEIRVERHYRNKAVESCHKILLWNVAIMHIYENFLNLWSTFSQRLSGWINIKTYVCLIVVIISCFCSVLISEQNDNIPLLKQHSGHCSKLAYYHKILLKSAQNSKQFW